MYRVFGVDAHGVGLTRGRAKCLDLVSIDDGDWIPVRSDQSQLEEGRWKGLCGV